MSDAINSQPPGPARVLRFEDYLRRHSTARTGAEGVPESPLGRPAGASLLNARQLTHRRVMLRYLQEHRHTP